MAEDNQKESSVEETSSTPVSESKPDTPNSAPSEDTAPKESTSTTDTPTSTDSTESADVDGDGDVDVSDVIIAQNQHIDNLTDHISQQAEMIDNLMDNYGELIDNIQSIQQGNSLKDLGVADKYVEVAKQLGITPENVSDMKENYGEIFNQKTNSDDSDEDKSKEDLPEVSTESRL